MRIFVDARMINHTGIGRHIRGHLSYLSKKHIIFAGISEVDQAHTVRLISKEIQAIDYPAPIYSIREQLAGSVVCKEIEGKVDFFGFRNLTYLFLCPVISYLQFTT